MQLRKRQTVFVGQQFGFLTIIARADPEKRHWRWRVRCKCGKERTIRSSHLTGKHGTRGCRSCSATTHGMTGTPLFWAWSHMRQRCKSHPRIPSHNWRSYGGRGITVCKCWQNSFQHFLDDMGPTYKSGLTIDRVDNNKGYSKKNCRWATTEEQSRNRQNSLPVNIQEISRQTGIKPATLYWRYARGLPFPGEKPCCK